MAIHSPQNCLLNVHFKDIIIINKFLVNNKQLNGNKIKLE